MSVPFVKAQNVHAAPVPEAGDRALIAIIDGGIDVLHKAFESDHKDTRILEIWDQTDDTKYYRQKVSDSGFVVN